MTNSLMPIALLSLIHAPLLFGGPPLFGGQELGEPGGKSSDIGSKDAVQAADYVLTSLQNWSASGITGASWIETPAREGALEQAIRRVNGGAPPRVHVESIEVGLKQPRKGGDTPHFRVLLDLRIQAVDELVVAATMLESFSEKLDEVNGELGVHIGTTRVDPATKTLHAPQIEIHLPVAGIDEAPERISRPLTKVIRKVSVEGSPLSSLKTSPSQRRLARQRVEHFLDVQLGGKDLALTAANCGSFLHRLSEGEDAIPVTELSLAKTEGTDEIAGGWRLEARLLIERGRQ